MLSPECENMLVNEAFSHLEKVKHLASPLRDYKCSPDELDRKINPDEWKNTLLKRTEWGMYYVYFAPKGWTYDLCRHKLIYFKGVSHDAGESLYEPPVPIDKFYPNEVQE